MQFHERLSKLMKERGLTQAQLCKLSGIATSAMSHYVRGETEPSFTKAILIANALGCSVDELAGRSTNVEVLNTYEKELLTCFRGMADFGRNSLLKTARVMRDEMPREAFSGRMYISADMTDDEADAVYRMYHENGS